MNESHYIPLDDRAVIRISGDPKADFLQGLITRDVKYITPENAIYTCLLSPQGKYLFDFFVVEYEESYLLDVDTDSLPTLLKTLKRYKLRTPITLEDASDTFAVTSLIGDNLTDTIADATLGRTHIFCEGIAYLDPRTLALGARAIINKSNNFQSFEARDYKKASYDSYEVKRVALGIPEGEKDMTRDSSYPLQWQIDAINGLDFDKGCYVGQEVTIRTKHKGTLRKSVRKIRSNDIINHAPNSIITIDNKKVGILGSTFENSGIALIEHDKLPSQNQAVEAMVDQTAITILA